MLKSPIKKLKGKLIITTLGYGDRAFADTYKRMGWSIRAHNGIDYVVGKGRTESYGTPIIASHKGVVRKVTFTTPLSTQGNGLTIEGEPFIKDGKRTLLMTTYWHLAEVFVNAGDRVEVGQEVGTMGNSGFVIGSDNDPFAGTHLHFMVYEYQDENGWKLKGDNPETGGTVNPKKWLEDNWRENAPEIDIIDINKQLHPLVAVVERAKVMVELATNKLKNLWK
jgi:murein DD-endopeptidase MepM/ murein hydrolase activator NlpD